MSKYAITLSWYHIAERIDQADKKKKTKGNITTMNLIFERILPTEQR